MTIVVPEVSYAVILTRDATRAAAAIRSIAAQTPPAELLLVLNDADDEMRTYARSVDDARIVHDGVDLGLVFGWNLAISEARAPHIFVIHEDTELQDGCAERLLKTLRERPDAGAVTAHVIQADGGEFEGNAIWRDGAFSRIRALPDGMLAVDAAPSSCVLVRADVLRGVGGFDERFFPAIYVDTSLSVAIWQAGRTVLCDPRARSLHRVGAMVDPARGPRRGTRIRSFLLARNRARFQVAFGPWLEGQAERSDAQDARHPTPDELADALARTRRREERVLAAPLAPLRDRLRLPDDLEAAARALRREVEDEFLAELVEREEALAGEVAGLHRVYGETRSELDRVHARYAELHAAHVGLRAELDRVHAAHAEQSAELERVHREYAALWDDRERLRGRPGRPAPEPEDHA